MHGIRPKNILNGMKYDIPIKITKYWEEIICYKLQPYHYTTQNEYYN